MQQDFILLALLIIVGFVGLYLFLKDKLARRDTGEDKAILQWLKSTQQDIQTLQHNLTQTLQRSDKNVTDTLQKSYQELNTRLDNAAKVMGELRDETGKFSEIGRSMKQLQDFLSSPKLRGNIGEQVLNDLVAQVLPKQAFKTQHRFRSGEVVDLVIKTQAGLIPVDSKFPMENFSKMAAAQDKKESKLHQKAFTNDVRKHIRDIAGKYIHTQEDTTDFAVMYIPSETMYYEITSNLPQVYDYAQENRVLPVSPATFYAFLRTILLSFEGQRIAKEAQIILQNLRDIQKTTTDFGDKLGVLGRHITNAHNNMTGLQSDFTILQTKIDTTRTFGAKVTRSLPES